MKTQDSLPVNRRAVLKTAVTAGAVAVACPMPIFDTMERHVLV